LPQLPNIVQWVEPAVAPKPRLHISPESLAKLRPRTRARRPVADLPLPAVPNQQPIAGELNIALSQPVAPKPRLPVTPMSVPLAGPRRDAGDAGPAPEIGPITPNGLGSSEFRSIIALSPEPAPPAPVELPPGNLASRLSMGPNLLGSGTAGSGNGSSPGGDSAGSGSGGGAGPPGVFISKPAANETSPVAGPPGSGTSNPAALPEAPKPLPARPEPGVARSRPLIEYEPRKLGTYDPTSPELVLGPKRVYTLHINAPNLTSRTGSWVVRFAELDEEAHNPPGAMRPDLVGPAPLRKVDPKYPPALMEARVEGEVVLYAIIRRDGTVDSVQVIRSVDPQLDRNAAEAFVRWKFRPAERNGLPVDVEAVVAIPFRASAPF
jgi:protein TonB